MSRFDNREGYIWFNGKLVDWKDAKVHCLTHGLHYGSSVFEGERAYNGKIFKSKQHTERFLESARLISFNIPYSLEEILKAKEDVLKANNLKDAYIRPFAWKGSDGLGVESKDIEVNTAIAAWEWGRYFSSDENKGLRLTKALFKRPSPDTEPVQSKASGLYMICSASKNNATNKGYDDALMLDYRGYIAEATAANIFFYMNDGKLYTPVADAFLNGITRQTVIAIAKEKGIEVVEKHMLPEEMKNAKECFLTGTAAEVQPVSEIWDQYKFQVGDMCNLFVSSYNEIVRL